MTMNSDPLRRSSHQDALKLKSLAILLLEPIQIPPRRTCRYDHLMGLAYRSAEEDRSLSRFQRKRLQRLTCSSLQITTSQANDVRILNPLLLHTQYCSPVSTKLGGVMT